MKIKNSTSLVVSLLAVALAGGCASDRAINPNITVYNRSTVTDRPIELPGNYNTDNFRRMTLALMPGALQSNAFNKDNMKYMSVRMQSELAKIKRFSIAAIHGNDTTSLQALEDVGEVNLAQQLDPTKIDLVASWNANLQAEENVDGSEKIITFICTINLTCKDLKNGLVKFAKDLDIRVKRAQKVNRAGMIVSGFAYRSQSDVEGLLQEIATQSAIRIANELGNEYPVGGKITGALGTDMMTLDKGFEEGIGKGMQMVIYANVGGVDVPLANADASPSANTSQLQIWRLNTRNKYAAKILKAIEADTAFLNNNRLYAVGYGMAYPPEWEQKAFVIPQ